MSVLVYFSDVLQPSPLQIFSFLRLCLICQNLGVKRDQDMFTSWLWPFHVKVSGWLSKCTDHKVLGLLIQLSNFKCKFDCHISIFTVHLSLFTQQCWSVFPCMKSVSRLVTGRSHCLRDWHLCWPMLCFLSFLSLLAYVCPISFFSLTVRRVS